MRIVAATTFVAIGAIGVAHGNPFGVFWIILAVAILTIKPKKSL